MEKLEEFAWIEFSCASEDVQKKLLTGSILNVLDRRPNAKVLFTLNKKKQRTHFAIYDCSIDLNEKGQVSREQEAPQRLSSLYEVRYNANTGGARLRQDFYADAWMSASMRLLIGEFISSREEKGLCHTSDVKEQ